MSEAADIRRAVESDLDHIAAIQAASPEAAQWTPGDYLAYECRVALTGRTVIGFLVWRTVGPAESEILNLAVAPEKRGLGVARQLVRNALVTVPGKWFLEVRESNGPARKLYRSIGFTETGIRPAYYGDSQESGIVMSFCS